MAEGFLYLKKNIGKLIVSAALRKNIPLLQFNEEESTDNYLSYQSSVRWDINKTNNIIFSLGKYHNLSNPSLILPRTSLNSSYQYAIDYTYKKNFTQIKLAAYHKKENGLTSNSFSIIDNSVNSRRISGIEFMLETYLTKNIIFQISNTFLDSQIAGDIGEFRGENDLDYFVKSSTSYYNKGFNLSLNYTIRPGNYFTPVSSSIFDEDVKSFIPIYEDGFNTKQYGSYSRLDLSLNKSVPLKGNNSLMLFATINNLLNSENQRNILFKEDYSFENFQFYQKRFLYIGMVLSL